jgi:hypothetical protein
MLFFGMDREGEFSVVLKSISLAILSEIWKARLRVNSNPSITTVELNMRHTLSKMFMASSGLMNAFAKKNISLYRKWWPAEQHRRG